LAISGGADSVCLGHLLLAAEIPFEMAHVNYHLRGTESDGDEDFVRKLSENWGVTLHVKNGGFNENDYPGMSVQMIAREIRYSWFTELIEQTKAEAVLLAHHFEDQIETILLNQMRGTGIEGVSGMSEKRDAFIRPLLPFRKKEMVAFLDNNSYEWREDSSNKKNIYKRNFLRNEVIPLIQNEFPEGLIGLDHTSKRLKDTGKAFFYLFAEWKKQQVLRDDGFELLELKAIENLPGKSSFLYYWLRDFGFQYPIIQDIIRGIEMQESGKTYWSRTHMVNLDRQHLILGSLESNTEACLIHENEIELSLGKAKYHLFKLKEDFKIDYSTQNAMLDFDKLNFPLNFRPLKSGDKFIPIGMKSHKKVSDLLVDLKIPVIKKKQVMVMTSGDEIAWVVGFRISEKFKCESNTKTVFYIKKHTNE
jgi:tRNA(Ile)-lysidine synthase